MRNSLGSIPNRRMGRTLLRHEPRLIPARCTDGHRYLQETPRDARSPPRVASGAPESTRARPCSTGKAVVNGVASPPTLADQQARMSASPRTRAMRQHGRLHSWTGLLLGTVDDRDRGA